MDARELTAHVRQYYIPVLVDQIFKANPLLARLRAKEQIILDGGRDINMPFMKGKLTGGSYEFMDTFDTSYVPTDDYLTWQWRGIWVNITIDNWSLALNNGAEAVIPLLDSKMQNAEMTISDTLGSWIASDPSDTKAFDGLWNGVDDGNTYSTYGGITRTVNFSKYATGNQSLNSYIDSVGGNITLDRLRYAMGQATVGTKKPDLILCRQNIYDQIWSRVQPQQRFLGTSHADLAAVGFDGITFDNCAILVDDHLPSGTMYLLNTDYIKLLVHKDRNFHFSDWQRPVNSDARIAQILTIGNFIIQAPRFCAKFTGLTEY